jgi:RhtB (resistance to homoserine/threonine) family protein
MIEFISITSVILLAAISPGPDFALVSRNALRYSQSSGIFTSLGIAVGTFFHAAYCIVGISIVISQSILLFNTIKLGGAAYLIFLGIKGLLEKKQVATTNRDGSKETLSKAQAFLQGIICNALNPKAVFFFLALFTTVITPSMPVFTQILYGVEIALVHFVWFALVSFLFSNDSLKSLLGESQHYVAKGFGALLILFGLNIAIMIE